GGMRQIGILAAAGQYAIENNFEKLTEDHEKAKQLAEHIAELPNIEMDLNLVQTNIIMFRPKLLTVEDVLQKCKDKGLLLGPGGVGVIRAVTHLDISFEDINSVKQILSEVFDA
ncbi:MAG: beta-eliminating lyase-related protein, partial [Bacteroidota bacterium]